eukprot:TRINITY_DN32253_c0_g2_i1.p1 TRINITY_DN32253_c0_g2~~TRINITY_DN32253_c0_g2_i1.p1  ORF type:complete len:526 (-),score=95.16 TRINITY_DN32253_c0_g2_i1:257-1744(-)
MPFICKTYEEDVDAEDESEFDEAVRVSERGDVPEDSRRSLCPECSRPLRRVAKLPYTSTFLMCMGQKECWRCCEDILAGEMHFACATCHDSKVTVCLSCGPGTFIERVYDFTDPATGEARVLEVPVETVHRRKKKRSVVTDNCNVRALAMHVVEGTRHLMERVASEEEMYDNEWDEDGLLGLLLGTNDTDDIILKMQQLIAEASRIVAQQPSLSEVDVPCKVFGDIHGQFRDVLLLFKAYGVPGATNGPGFVFNGDFIDRGRHQLEVLCVLIAHKIAFPTEVYLNRGNHEDMHMNKKYGFKSACVTEFGEYAGTGIYEAANAFFDYLPLGCLIGGRVIAVHGGIGDGKWTVDQLRDVKRPLSHDDLALPSNQWIWNILWSDPIEEDARRLTFGVHTSPRSKTAFNFGWNVTSAFCTRNGLDLVIRSHQVGENGYGFDIMHNNSVMRVFSARDYEGHGNDAAVLHVSQEDTEDDHLGLLRVRPQVLSSMTKAASVV